MPSPIILVSAALALLDSLRNIRNEAYTLDLPLVQPLQPVLSTPNVTQSNLLSTPQGLLDYSENLFAYETYVAMWTQEKNLIEGRPSADIVTVTPPPTSGGQPGGAGNPYSVQNYVTKRNNIVAQLKSQLFSPPSSGASQAQKQAAASRVASLQANIAQLQGNIRDLLLTQQAAQGPTIVTGPDTVTHLESQTGLVTQMIADLKGAEDSVQKQQIIVGSGGLQSAS